MVRAVVRFFLMAACSIIENVVDRGSRGRVGVRGSPGGRAVVASGFNHSDWGLFFLFRPEGGRGGDFRFEI